MEVTPLNFTDIQPPGAPDAAVICAPANFPANAPSKVCGGVLPVSSSADTEATALAALLRFTDVAKPVTTTSSKPVADSSMATFKVVGPVTCISFEAYPKEENTRLDGKLSTESS